MISGDLLVIPIGLLIVFFAWLVLIKWPAKPGPKPPGVPLQTLLLKIARQAVREEIESAGIRTRDTETGARWYDVSQCERDYVTLATMLGMIEIDPADTDLVQLIPEEEEE